MTHHEKVADARRAANGYAPVPDDSALMYGMVGLVLGGLLMITLSEFYSFSLVPHGIMITAGLITAFIAGAALRALRKRAHARAYDDEFARQK